MQAKQKIMTIVAFNLSIFDIFIILATPARKKIYAWMTRGDEAVSVLYKLHFLVDTMLQIKYWSGTTLYLFLLIRITIQGGVSKTLMSS